MMHRKLPLAATMHLAGLLLLALAGQCAALESVPSCGPIEGTYYQPRRFTIDDTLEISRQGNRYRFRLNASWAKQPNDGSETHTGTSEGSFIVNNCRAQFDDPDNACRLVFTFKGKNAVRIEQEEACTTFGAHVEATGDYRKK